MMLKTANRVAEDAAITISQIQAVIACLDETLSIANGSSAPFPFLTYRSKRIFEAALALRKRRRTTAS
jgi:hypothetical protein